MNIPTIILFFVYNWGLGFTFTSFTANSENFLERNIIRIGIGTGIFVFLGVLMNLFRIPLDWKIFLVFSLVYPLFVLFKKIKSKSLNIPKLNLRLTKSNLNIIIVLIMVLFSLFMYAGGAFNYPYLEDDDPWAHAESTKYIAVEKTAFEPEHGRFSMHYIDPYPPGYNILMGTLHQTNDSVYWTLKFFNGLILSLAILFFYFFAKIFTQNKNKALFATFVLALIPSFFTHFIWAHSFVIMLIFPALYCLEMIKKDKKWILPSLLVISAIPLTHSSEAIKIGIMLFIYWLIKAIYSKKLLTHQLTAIIGGYIISLLWWFNKASLLFGQTTTKLINKGLADSTQTSIISKVLNFFLPDSGSASAAYSFSDFFRVKPEGLINVQPGWGILITLLLIIGIIYIFIKYKETFKRENIWIPITLAWFIFAFLGTNSMTFNLPVGLFAFRFWLLLAIPVALISSLGLFYLIDICKKINIPNLLTKIIVILIIIVIAFTSGLTKYRHNTSENWPPGAKWTSAEELNGYIWLQENTPNNALVFKYAKPLFIFGLDKYSCEWCEDTIDFREELLHKDAKELHSWLKSRNYEYLTLGGMDFKYISEQFGENETQELLPKRIEEIQSSGLFRLTHQTQGMVILEVI